MKKMNKKGFTLTELVIVIVIIAILAAVLIPSMTGYVNRAKKSNAQSEASSVYTVYAAWLADDQTENSYYKVTHDADNNTIPSATWKTSDWNAISTLGTPDGLGVTVYDVETRPYVGTVTNGVSSAESSLVYAFAQYYAKAQGSEVTGFTTYKKESQTADLTAEASSTEAATGTAVGYYAVGKLKFVACGNNGFYMISSNDFAVYCELTDGVPSYTIGDKQVTSLGAIDGDAKFATCAKELKVYTAKNA